MTSYSSTNRFNTCPWAYKLAKDGLRKVTAGPESNKMAWGAAMHRALKAIYSGGFGETEFLAAYPEDLDPADEVWSRAGGIRTVEAYVSYYQDIDKQWEVLEVELADDPVKPSLIIDLIARHRQTGSIYFWDHKFKSKMPWDVNKSYQIDSQMMRYTAFTAERYGECAGAVVNIVVPGYRARAYKGEPAGWYWKFKRETVGFTLQQLEFWQTSQEQWEQVIVECELNDRWPKHLGYNCSRCEFYEACYSAMDEEVVATLYTTGPVEQPFSVVVEEEGL